MARVPNIRGTDSVPAGPLAWLKEWLESVRTWIRMRDPAEATVGDVLDKFTTRGDLVQWGVMTRNAGGQFVGSGGGGGGPITIVVPPGGGGGGTYTPDFTPPPTPTGLVVTAGITNIYIGLDAPTYTVGNGHAATNIYGAIWEQGDTEPTFSDPRTKLIDNIVGPGTFHAYGSNPATRWCIWIKFQTRDGIESTAPAGGTHGVQATTGQDVAALLQILTGQITISQLFTDLATPILGLGEQLDAAASNSLAALLSVHEEQQSRATALLNEARDRGTSITDVRRVVAEGDSQLAQRIVTLTAAVGGNTAGLQTEQTARADGDAAEAFQRNLLAAQVNDPTTGLPATRATLLTNYSTTVSMDAAIAASTSTVTARLDSFGGSGVAVETIVVAQASSITGLLGQYTVKIDVNGYISGFGLANTLVGATPFSQFIFRADSFSIASPSGPDITPIVPFIVRTTPGTVNGVAYPAGVYMDSAFILDLTAAIARMGVAWVDDAKIGSLSAAKLTVGDGTVGGDLKSTIFTSGSAGWRIRPNGTAEFSGVIARGTIVASAGAIGGITIGSNAVYSSNFVAGTSGFRIHSDGSAEFNSVFARGALSNGTAARSGTTMTGSGVALAADGSGSWGTPTVNITHDGAQIRINGPLVTDANLVLAALSVSASPSAVGSSASDASPVGHGTTTATASGGTGPYTYAWAVVSQFNDPSGATGTAFISGLSGTGGQTCGLGTIGQSDNSQINAIYRCIVTDANGRSAAADVTLIVTRGTPP